MHKQLTETILHSDTVYNGLVMRVTRDRVSLPNGRISIREVVRHRGAVCVLPLTEDGHVLLVEQFRHGTSGVTREIPAGKLEKEGEDPLTAAKRELKEETGATSARWIDLGSYYGSPAILAEEIRMYLALDISVGESQPDAEEFLHVKRIPLATLVEAVMRGEIVDGKTQCAVLRASYLAEHGLI